MVAGYAAKELASQGLNRGELTVVSADNAVPYERPPLSKGFLSGKDNEASILINAPDWYREHGIEVRLNTVIEHVDPTQKRLRSNSGEEFECEHLLLATGARAKKLDCPGNDLGNVLYLRSLKDSETIRSRSEDAKAAVIVGGGFIGMEVASVLAQKNIRTTLMIREERVWSRVFTPVMSAFFEQYYTARGVRIVKQARVVAIEGKGGVQAVLLGDNEKISCDLVVVGVGAVPVTELLEKTVIAIDDGIVVNEYLEPAAPVSTRRETLQIILIPSSGNGGVWSIGTMLFLKVSIGRGLSSEGGNRLCMSHISFRMFLTSRMNCRAIQLAQAKLKSDRSRRNGSSRARRFHRSVCQTRADLR